MRVRGVQTYFTGAITRERCIAHCDADSDCHQAVFEASGPWGPQCWLGHGQSSVRPTNSRPCDGRPGSPCVDFCYSKNGWAPMASTADLRTVLSDCTVRYEEADVGSFDALAPFESAERACTTARVEIEAALDEARLANESPEAAERTTSEEGIRLHEEANTPVTEAPVEPDTEAPTFAPTMTPTEVPTTLPPTTDEPSYSPTHTPTEVPTPTPTEVPTDSPATNAPEPVVLSPEQGSAEYKAAEAFCNNAWMDCVWTTFHFGKCRIVKEKCRIAKGLMGV